MVDLIILEKVFTSLAIGLIIGFEREIAQDKVDRVKFAGLRTFALTGLIGGLSAYMTGRVSLIPLMALFSLTVLIAIAYYRSTGIDRKLGVTTEISLILTFFLGWLAFYDASTAVILAIIITSMLAFKKQLHDFTHRVPKDEFYDSLKFALIALVILPLLPNRTIGPLDVFNPYEVWMVVVFISGIGFAGYFMVKWFGARSGMALTGIVGGMASSTAVTTTMASRTRESGGLEMSAMVASTLANVIMLLRVMLLAGVLYPAILYFIYIPMGVMFVTGILVASYFYIKERAVPQGETIRLKSPFSIMPAITFAALITIILFVSKLASVYLGSYGLYATAVFAGLADVDAITVSVSQLASKGITDPIVAVTAIMIAVFVNLAIRIIYAYYFGTKKFAAYTAGMVAVMICSGAAAVAFMAL